VAPIESDIYREIYFGNQRGWVAAGRHFLKTQALKMRTSMAACPMLKQEVLAHFIRLQCGDPWAPAWRQPCASSAGSWRTCPSALRLRRSQRTGPPSRPDSARECPDFPAPGAACRAHCLDLH
jgi:hypothetical protein